jgi:hypothetical protein
VISESSSLWLIEENDFEDVIEKVFELSSGLNIRELSAQLMSGSYFFIMKQYWSQIHFYIN